MLHLPARFDERNTSGEHLAEQAEQRFLMVRRQFPPGRLTRRGQS
jgi:hypothetical protein